MRPWIPGVLLVAGVVGAFANPVLAQRGGEQDPHVLLPGGLDRASAQEILKRKLRRNQDLQQTRDLLQEILKNPGKFVPEDDVKRFLEQAAKDGKIDPGNIDPSKIDPNDPALKNLMDKIDPDSLTPEQRDSLKRMGEVWKNSSTRPPAVDVQPRPDPGMPPVQPPMPPQPPVGPRPELTPVNQLPSATPPRPREQSNWFTRQMKKLTPKAGDGVTSKSSGLGNSEWSRSVRQMSRDYMPRFQTDGLSRKMSGPSLRSPRLRSPSVPDVNVPRGSVGTGGGGAGGAASGAGTVFLVLFLLVLAGVAAWVIYRIVQQRREADARDPAVPGAWPVNPGQIRTRADLVRAFEYLALLLLGLPARTNHHLEISDRLGRTPAESPDRREAADELARLYEQARYTPPDEELSPAETEAARRDLALLSGASAS